METAISRRSIIGLFFSWVGSMVVKSPSEPVEVRVNFEDIRKGRKEMLKRDGSRDDISAQAVRDALRILTGEDILPHPDQPHDIYISCFDGALSDEYLIGKFRERMPALFRRRQLQALLRNNQMQKQSA